MKQVKTLRHKILNHSKTFDSTVEIYNQALNFILEIIEQEFADLENISTKTIVPLVEKLIHRTSKNPQPKYSQFDTQFHKFPCYFRRAAIATAYGKIKSYRTLLQNWKNEKLIAKEFQKTFTKKPPKLSLDHNEFPVFYKKNMFNRTGDCTANIKVYHQNDWVWKTIIFKSQDIYIRDVWDWKECNPRLTKVGKKYFLNISYEKNIKLNNTKIGIATFTTGKVYHADLSASYNIGARYFIREILKPFPEMERLALQAKVPELAKRTMQTLSSLISLNMALN